MLNDFQRIEMVRKCEDAVKAQARDRQRGGQGGVKNKPLSHNELGAASTPQHSRATDELGAMAGVSHSTYEHAVEVLDNAPTPVIDATRKKQLSINTAYEVTKLPQEKQTEISERMEKGESPRKAVAEVKANFKLPEVQNPSPKTTKMLLSITEETLDKVRAIAVTEKKPVPIMLVRLIDEAISARKNEAVKK